MRGIINTKDYETFTVDNIQFVGAASARHALPNDTVEFEDGCVTNIVLRANHTNLVGTLEISGKTKYGYTSRNVPIYLFIPWNEAYPPFYVGSSHTDKSKNLIALIDFESWAANANCPRGNCKQIIGTCGTLEAEETGLKYHTHGVKWKRGLELMPRIPFLQGGAFLDTDTFHVDPEGCRDIDDAISIWVHNSYIEVRIHIADVASLLSNNSILWCAEWLGETLYKNGAIESPLFPKDVQEDCSLTPGSIKHTLTLAFTWCLERECIVKKWWLQQDIIVKKSYTYDTIEQSSWAALLKQIASGLAKREVTDSHEWIAELMLFYNKEAAKVVQGAQKGILRRHSEPDRELLTRLEQEGIAPSFLAFKAGEYCDSTDLNTTHWGLKESAYCHATSPIRRWVDCINQSIIIQTLFIPEFVVPPYVISSVNQRSRLIKAFERDLFFVKVLLSNTGKKVIGHVILAGPKKAKVWVPEWDRCVSIYEYLTAGATIEISVYMNPSNRNWKRRLILEVEEAV